VLDACSAFGVASRISSVWKDGGMGGMAVAEAILAEMASHRQSRFHHLYPDDIALDRKLDVIARRLYGADGINLLPAAAAKLIRFERHGYRALPICVAKTQNSLSDDPRRLGRPSGFQIVIRDAKLAAGAGSWSPMLGRS
jgi:formate--tetrahydrofolate ligase